MAGRVVPKGVVITLLSEIEPLDLVKVTRLLDEIGMSFAVSAYDDHRLLILNGDED